MPPVWVAVPLTVDPGIDPRRVARERVRADYPRDVWTGYYLVADIDVSTFCPVTVQVMACIEPGHPDRNLRVGGICGCEATDLCGHLRTAVALLAAERLFHVVQRPDHDRQKEQ